MIALSPLFALLLVRLWLPASVFGAGCPLRDRLRASGPEGSSLCQCRLRSSCGTEVVSLRLSLPQAGKQSERVFKATLNRLREDPLPARAFRRGAERLACENGDYACG